MRKKFKQLCSGLLSAVMTLSALPLSAIHAEDESNRYPYAFFAGSTAEGAITISADNVCINGNIATNGTMVTSAANFNVNGEIIENAAETMIQCFQKIDDAYFSSSTAETYSENYFLEDTNINVDAPIETDGAIELIGNINISSGLKALNDIRMSGNVENTQNSAIYSKTGDIIIDTENVNLNGIVYAPKGNVNISATNLNINSVVIIADTITISCPNMNANYSTLVGELIGRESEGNTEIVPVLDFGLTAYGEYNSDTNSIEIYWDTTIPQGTFDIQISDDGENYSSVAEITDEDSYDYIISEPFSQKYIKVIETVESSMKYETIPFIVRNTDDGYVIEPLDSDEDGLPDIFELKINTAIDNADTDSDGLTDYQELVIVGTDPTKYDSAEEGTSDSDFDSDSDGLSNIDEITRNTDPRDSDTDMDGLSDYDEIFVYDTDPLVADSDNDGIDDSSEIKLGLDPNSAATHGVPDGEYKIDQAIDVDNGILSSINTEESPYSLSIEMKTNGDIEKEISVVNSGYSNVIENDAMIGASLDISLSDVCDPEDIVLKYDIKPEFIGNTLDKYSTLPEFQDIKRLNVFKFNEEENMLLPIETKFSDNGTQLYAEVDELGTYCVMDMEIWLDNLGVEFISNKSNISNMELNLSTIKIMSDEATVVNKVSFNGHTYVRYDITGMSWNDAQKRCTALGGHLVTINSYAEQDFINNKLLAYSKANTYWIGCSFSDGKWKWVTNEIFNFTNWALGEPNNLDKEHYSHIYGKFKDDIPIGKWNNTLENNRNSGTFYDTLYCGFICEWDNAVEYEIHLPNSWKRVKLDAEISPNNGANTDKDGFTDWEEIDTTKLVWHTDGSFELPMFNTSDAVKMLQRYRSGEIDNLIDFKPIRYLPVLSDPTIKNTDGDALDDDLDPDPLFHDPDPLSYTNILSAEIKYIPLQKIKSFTGKIGRKLARKWDCDTYISIIKSCNCNDDIFIITNEDESISEAYVISDELKNKLNNGEAEYQKSNYHIPNEDAAHYGKLETDELVPELLDENSSFYYGCWYHNYCQEMNMYNYYSDAIDTGSKAFLVYITVLGIYKAKLLDSAYKTLEISQEEYLYTVKEHRAYNSNRTNPSMPKGSKPFGIRAEGKAKGIKAQNDAADLLAENGYKVEMLEERPDGNGYGIQDKSSPDYLIENRPFDCYSPETNNSVSIIRQIAKKTREQADRVVLNLTNAKVTDFEELTAQILSKTETGDLKHLQELIVIYHDEIIELYVR